MLLVMVIAGFWHSRRIILHGEAVSRHKIRGDGQLSDDVYSKLNNVETSQL